MPICNHSLPLPSLPPSLAPGSCPSFRCPTVPARRFFDLHRRNPGSVSGSVGMRSVHFRGLCHGRKACSAGNGRGASADTATEGFFKKRSIVEHILLLTTKADLSEDEERDMLDHLYTSQYQMNGILAISLGSRKDSHWLHVRDWERANSIFLLERGLTGTLFSQIESDGRSCGSCDIKRLGRIAETNIDNFTHAVYMRFLKEEDVEKFYVNPYYLGILKGHIIPYCYRSISVDYESEVEDDMLSIFRRGEEFNYGVECVLLFSIVETASSHIVEDAMATFQKLILQFNSIIVQATKGTNLKLADSEYTHAAVMRFPSSEALKMFRESSAYKDVRNYTIQQITLQLVWRLKFIPIINKSLLIHFHVDPVGTELM